MKKSYHRKVMWREFFTKKTIRIMKMYVIIALMTFGELMATDVLTQNISLDIRDKPLSEAMTKIEQMTEYHVFYNSKLVDLSRKITVQIQNATLENALGLLFSSTEIDFILVKNLIVLFRKGDPDVEEWIETIKKEIPPLQNNQSISANRIVPKLQRENISIKPVKPQVSGMVTDQLGEPLIGVNVLIKGTNRGTSTDFEGRFTLDDVDEQAVLVVSYVGYQTQEVDVAGKSNLTITLTSDSQLLDEVVVVGYGTQKKRDITGSVESFNSEVIETMPVSNIAQILQGRLSGVTITQREGNAEGSTSILVRGQNSLTASNSPLIILDGIPFSGGLSAINPNDVESLEVLKDASSSAIYGARASNGVILITTKKGKPGKPSISYSGNYSVSNVINLPDMMDGETFYNRKVEFFKTDNNVIEDFMTPTELEVYGNRNFVDWVDLATRQGHRQEHTLSISGGTSNSSYYISGAMNSTQGVAENDNFKRFTSKINYKTEINDWISLGTNTLLGYFDRSGQPAPFDFSFGNSNTLRQNPLTKAYNEDGSLTMYPWEEDVYWGNPLEPTLYLEKDITRSVNTNNYAEVKFPIDGLSYRINTGYTFRNRLYESYRDRNTKYGFVKGGYARTYSNNHEEWIIENIVNYKKDFGDHSVFLTGLFSAQKNQTKEHGVSGENFTDDIMTYYQFGATDVLNLSDNFSESSFISQMIRANYGYKSKYLLTLTARRDGFSGFGAKTKFGVFPSLALAWNITNEEFISNFGTNWVDNLKVRLSYGRNGNMAIGPYSTLAQLSTINYLDKDLNTSFGYYPRALGDPTLGWETSKTINAGVDFGLMESRIQGSIDYFNTNTTDLLLNKQISPVNGTNNITQNIGETKSYGLEFQVSSVNIDRTDFRWNSDFNISLYRTKIVHVGLTDSLGNYIDDIANGWFIGEPDNVFYGYLYDGVWQSNDGIENPAQPDASPGDVKYVDLNSDGEITDEDRGIAGNQQPSFIAGLNNSIKYKNFTLSFFIYTVQGVTRSNPLWSTFVNNYNTNVYNFDFWSDKNPTDEFPANRDGTNPLNAKPRGDGSFIRLKDVTLSYVFGSHLTKRLKMSHLEVFVNAKNLATITDYKYGWDPEFISNNAIPQSTTYVVGLRVRL